MRIPGKIPIVIHPTFWLVAALIGFLNSFSFLGTLVWIVVIFVSVIVHELGHALSALSFGLRPKIELVAFGGLTYHRGDKLAFWKQFLIVLFGPVFGFLLFVAAWLLLKLPFFATGFYANVLTLFYWVNLIWTALNLVPVMPLDGGQLLRIVLEAFFGVKGFKYALVVGSIVSVVLSLLFFLYQRYFIGALFFLFGFQSFDMWQKTRKLSDNDRDNDLKQVFEKGEKDFKEHSYFEAHKAFTWIREKVKSGLFYHLATQYLALILDERKESKAAYDLLMEVRGDLSSDSLSLLHKLAFEQKDYATVRDLASACFQVQPSPEIALRSAKACAYLGDVKAAVGWLETAAQEGLEGLPNAVKDPAFDAIKNEALFKTFLNHHRL